MKKIYPLLLCVGILAAPVRAQTPDQDADAPATRQLKEYIRSQMMASQDRLDKARGGRPAPAPYSGLPDTVSPTLPEDQGFVLDERFPGEELVADVSGLEKAGLKISDVVDDEEWARLPDRRTIRRDRSRGYEIWHYPVGTRLIHRITLKTDRRVVELRLLQKLDDDASGDGPWAFGIYRPVKNGGRLLRLYKGTGKPESVAYPLPGRTGRFTWTRLELSSCRECHVDMGDGWYQYSDRDHAGPCGFVPLNPALLKAWAKRYQARHGYFPFIGP